MTHATESDIQKAIVDALVWDGWLIMRLNSGAMQPDDGARYVPFVTWAAIGAGPHTAGAPDLIAARDGRVAFIECKTRKGRLRDMQRDFAGACEHVGAEYIVARDLSDVAHLLTRVELGPKPGMRAVEVVP